MRCHIRERAGRSRQRCPQRSHALAGQPDGRVRSSIAGVRRPARGYSGGKQRARLGGAGRADEGTGWTGDERPNFVARATAKGAPSGLGEVRQRRSPLGELRIYRPRWLCGASFQTLSVPQHLLCPGVIAGPLIGCRGSPQELYRPDCVASDLRGLRRAEVLANVARHAAKESLRFLDVGQ